MNCFKLFFCFFALAFGAAAEGVYQIRHLSERELLKTYTSVMVDACNHSAPLWKIASFDPAAGYWGDGVSEGNQGLRSIGQMVLVSGSLLKYSDVLSDAERASYLGKVQAAIRYSVATHVTGTQKCPDGKSWGNSWQSAMWAGTLGFGAWLVWDDLDAQSQKEVERVLGSETDRFLVDKPPGGSFSDTKAEENGWNLICISVTANMFPKHPHAAAWNEKAIEYMMNTFSAPQDQEDQTLVDGRPVREWFASENIHSDFTLENHGFFHPAYVACSSYFLTQTAMHFTHARRPVPQAATHHLLDAWQMFQKIILPSGEPAYPQGMDWELHGISVINLFASLATHQKDPLAAQLEQKCLQYMRAWQVMENGNLAVPGSRLGFTRHSICAEQAAYGFLAHKIFGPPAQEISTQKAAAQLSGVETYKFAEFITHRTGKKLFSFSWKNKIMGMLIPIGEGHDSQPYFTVPIPNGFVGSIELTPAGDKKIKVVEHAETQTADGIETTGILLTNGERLKQMLKVTSIGDEAVVYQDRVTALADVSVAQERGVPLGIENDKITGDIRHVFNQTGKEIFDSKRAPVPAVIAGDWANVDGRLGVIMVAGSGMGYVPSPDYLPGISVRVDTLYASFSDQPKSFKAGEQVARRVALCFVEVSPKQTAAIAKTIRIVEKSGGQVLRFKLPHGGEVEVPLL